MATRILSKPVFNDNGELSGMICLDCKKEKDISLFYKDSGGKYGYRTICKKCSLYRQKKNKNYISPINRDETGNVISKVCSTCKETKSKDSFYKKSGAPSGLCGRCIDCMKFINSLPEKRIKSTLYNAKGRCKHFYAHKGIQCFLTLDDVKFLWVRDKAHLLKNPSLDRIDNDGHYTLENCQFIEFSENNLKDRKRRKIQMMDLHGNVLKIFPSLKDAVSGSECSHSHLWSVLNGEGKTAKGFIWKYLD